MGVKKIVRPADKDHPKVGMDWQEQQGKITMKTRSLGE